MSRHQSSRGGSDGRSSQSQKASFDQAAKESKGATYETKDVIDSLHRKIYRTKRIVGFIQRGRFAVEDALSALREATTQLATEDDAETQTPEKAQYSRGDTKSKSSSQKGGAAKKEFEAALGKVEGARQYFVEESDNNFCLDVSRGKKDKRIDHGISRFFQDSYYLLGEVRSVPYSERALGLWEEYIRALENLSGEYGKLPDHNEEFGNLKNEVRLERAKHESGSNVGDVKKVERATSNMRKIKSKVLESNENLVTEESEFNNALTDMKNLKKEAEGRNEIRGSGESSSRIVRIR